MKVGDWDFSKLPEERHEEVIKFVNDRSIGKLVNIHDQYELSSFKAYCCHNNGQYTINFYRVAIKKGFIKSNGE